MSRESTLTNGMKTKLYRHAELGFNLTECAASVGAPLPTLLNWLKTDEMFAAQFRMRAVKVKREMREKIEERARGGHFPSQKLFAVMDGTLEHTQELEERVNVLESIVEGRSVVDSMMEAGNNG